MADLQGRTALVEPWHLRGFSTDQRTAGLPTSFGDAFDNSRRGVDVEVVAGEVVQKEQGFGALHDQIIDAHCDEVDALASTSQKPVSGEADDYHSPTVSWMLALWATTSFVPTPSVPATMTGSLKPACFKSNNPPNPPMTESQPGRAVALTTALILSTSRLPASIETPADAYVRPSGLLPDAVGPVGEAEKALQSMSVDVEGD